jgi:acyl phosphate:glycerol-3-phosphate acyltransferase
VAACPLRAVLAILLSIAAGYLLGSIPFGLIFGRLAGVDVRQHGSKNIGATNVWRVCGAKFGLPVFVLDAGKGVAAVLLAQWLAARFGGDPQWAGIAGAMACVLGHSFPVWLKFKGGKGVATSLGVLLAMLPVESVAAFALWGVLLYLTRYVSVASIFASLSLGLFAAIAQWLGYGRGWPYVGFAVVAGILVVVRHKANIQRLLAGTESRLGKKKEASS